MRPSEPYIFASSIVGGYRRKRSAWHQRTRLTCWIDSGCSQATEVQQGHTCRSANLPFVMDAEAKIALFLTAFRSRPDVHAERWEQPGREKCAYRPVWHPLDEVAAEKHLRGEVVLGAYP